MMTIREVRMTLPLPPTVNVWKRPVVRKRRLTMVKSDAFTDYTTAARLAMIEQRQRKTMLTGRLELEVVLHFANQRANDLDNRMKALLDTLEECHVIEDDKLIDVLIIRRGAMDRRNPRAEVLIKEISQ